MLRYTNGDMLWIMPQKALQFQCLIVQQSQGKCTNIYLYSVIGKYCAQANINFMCVPWYFEYVCYEGSESTRLAKVGKKWSTCVIDMHLHSLHILLVNEKKKNDFLEYWPTWDQFGVIFKSVILFSSNLKQCIL